MNNFWQSRVTMLCLGALVGIVVGMNLAGIWPQVPVHATATWATEGFTIATGPVDERTEALYVLDTLTYDLRAVVLNNQVGRFLAFFTYNIGNDFEIDSGKNPKFLMVTGVADVPRGRGRQIQTRSVVYIAEANSGQVACYLIPWNQTFQSARKPQYGNFVFVDKKTFRTAEIRD
ncbi:MAG: hypothetical protein ACC645_22120 [Pirellulales bacterium]